MGLGIASTGGNSVGEVERQRLQWRALELGRAPSAESGLHWRTWLQGLVDSRFCTHAIAVFILLNACVLAFDHHDMDKDASAIISAQAGGRGERGAGSSERCSARLRDGALAFC